jgi:membrane fusion protein, multidrug efflux system
MKLLIACVLGSIGCCLLVGCKGAADEAEPAPTAVVEIQPAARHSMDEALVAYGAVDFVPARTRALTVQVESQVAERFVLPGTHVKAGQALMRLVPSAASHLDVDKASRDAAVAEADAQRQARLRAQGLATDSDLRTAKAAAETAIALRDSLNSRIGVHGVTLQAPIDGVVDAFTAQPGDVIAPGTPVIRIADPKALYVRVGLEAEDAVRVKDGQAVTISTLSSTALSVGGRISEVDARVDATSRLAGAVAQPDANSQLVPGSAVRARIILDTHADAITVPRSAVLYEDEQPFVYVATEGKAHRKPVKLGLLDDTQAEITQGVNVGDSVITGGNYELEDGMAVQLAAQGEKEADDEGGSKKGAADDKEAADAKDPADAKDAAEAKDAPSTPPSKGSKPGADKS